MDRPKIPISVSPQSGQRTTQFQVTIEWSKLSAEDFAKYNTNDIYIRPYRSNDRPLTTGVINASGRPYQDAAITVSDFPLPEGEHTVYIHIDLDPSGVCRNYEVNPGVITVSATSSTPDTVSGKKFGDSCDPTKQSIVEFKCPDDAPCLEQIDKTYRCGNPNCTAKPAITAQCNEQFKWENPISCPYPPTGGFNCGTPNATLCEAHGQFYCQTTLQRVPLPTPPCEDTNRKEDGSCGQFGIGGVVSIPTDPSGFVKGIFGILLGLSGGIAIALIIASGYQLMFSQGNKEGVQAARERLTSAIVGLLFLIFSMVILQIIGVDILGIPGFRP